MAVLHPTAANKTRPNDSNDVFCCLEIKNRSLHLWHQNLKMQKMSIISQLKREGISTEGTGEGLKPLLKEDTEFTMGSLEDRLRSRSRQLASSLSRLHKKNREALLEKSFIVDVKIRDVVPVNSLISTIDNLRYAPSAMSE